ncbi:MAG: FFLEELY motif protein, partial [Burkholderiales bacterium]
MSPAPPTAAARIADQLAQLREGHDGAVADPALGAALSRLRGWQSRRLRATYTDLAESPRYAQAIAFFQEDLYGPGDFSRRDADLARIVPVMTRMLPARMLEVVADATDLNALSFRLDRALLA